MEDQVPFKVFAYWDEESKPEVRRFGVEKSTVTSFHYLNAKLHDVFPGLKTKGYSVTWKDEEGDNVTISSDEEMVTALSALCGGNLIKLNVYVKDAEEKEDDCEIVITSVTDNPTVGPSNLPHYGVTCDGCEAPIVGFRYKCTSCADFDLCSKCEASGIHPEHCMVRVPSPVMPRALIKAAIKKSRHFLKSVAVNNCDEGSHHKRHRRDKSGERRHHSGEHHRGDHHRGEHHRPRHSWLETFATYMNEFANLAGDAPQDSEQKKTDEQPKTGTDNAQAPQQSEASTSTPHPFHPGVENIPKLVEMCFNGTLVKHLAQQIPVPPPANASQTAPSQTATEASSSANTNDVEMAEGNKKAQDEDKNNPQSDDSGSSGAEAGRDSSPDKADGWTVINKENDLMDATDKPSAPNAAIPLGFNLPKEFQAHLHLNEAANAANQSVITPVPAQPTPPQQPTRPQPSIYPWGQAFPQSHAYPQAVWAPTTSTQHQPGPVNAPHPAPISAPMLVPVSAPMPAQVSAPQPAPVSAPQPKPAPLPQPKSYHPKPHIDAAIKQMLAMGFTNEGGWLTQLLESRDGNIAAVLDLLTPVNPVKPK